MSEEEKSLDLKQGDETPSDQGQSEQKTGSEEVRTEVFTKKKYSQFKKKFLLSIKNLKKFLMIQTRRFMFQRRQS